MIFDRLSEADPYFCMGENFRAGFEYLRATSFDTVTDGIERFISDTAIDQKSLRPVR